ncbi:hypothetical protein SAMN05660642_04916 [Geodermatophilus siccatus]|uniref:O-antigen ligase n=1 Tax=Geodermatophilus siccatus TaxID=1137991 RepID=A0A1H0BQT8_9ACTN|nr:hypothetical protein [Geodermatophilus siccatus]SDN47893.1 hypothetical protein SAMN05660642_04916 [Geodermatophilus siccatus]
MVASTVAWRRGDIFAGAVDPVVVVKGLLSLLALAIALVVVQTRGGHLRQLGTGTLWFLGIFMTVSAMGALTYGTLVTSAVLTFRLLVLGSTVFLLLRAAPALQVVGALVRSCAAIALLAAMTGVVMAGQEPRLEGGIPPAHPNELALLSSVVVVWVVARVVVERATWLEALTAVVLLGVVWATGSRTALIMLVVAVLAMTVLVRRPRAGLVVGTQCILAVGIIVVYWTGAIVSFGERAPDKGSTLESRFIAWSAARTWAESAWQAVFGGGLSVKLIPVKGQWWDQQLLDSTWVSALVQAGVLGLLVAVVWAIWVLRGVVRAPREHRVLFLGLFVFLVGRSLLESGLFDATPAFLLFVAVSVTVEGGSRSSLTDPSTPRTAAPA